MYFNGKIMPFIQHTMQEEAIKWIEETDFLNIYDLDLTHGACKVITAR